jgi:hypothetical protein
MPGARRPLRAGLTLLALAAAFAACGGPPPEVEAARDLGAPAVYRVSAQAESRFSGPVSDLRAATDLTAVFEVTPVSETAIEVEALYVAADVSDAAGEPVGLDLGPLAGATARVEMGPPGTVSAVRGDPALLDAPVPLISVRELVAALFSPLPQERLREDDTWTGDVPVPFANLDGNQQRMRYLLASVNGPAGMARVEGYELRLAPRSFAYETAAGRVSGEGDLEMTFEGELEPGNGYGWTERTAEFDSRYIRLPGGAGYANGSLHMEYTSRIDRLNAAEQLALDTSTRREP